MGPRRVPEEWTEEQCRLAKLRVDEDQTDWIVRGQVICGLDRVGGVDVSFFPDSTYAVAAVVVLSFNSFEVLYARCANIRLAVPYIPSFLAFREVPALATLLDEIPQEHKPQVVLVDGNGAFHPRRCGAATHLGILAKLPTIGVAKKVQKVDDVGQKRAFKLAEQLQGASDWVPLTSAAGEKEGKEPLAVLLRPSSGKAMLVVSSGHRVSLSTAVTLTAALCCNSSVPEPIRQADLKSRGAIREWFGGKDVGDLEVPEGLLPALPSLKRPAPVEPEQPSLRWKAKGSKERRTAATEAVESTAQEEADQPSCSRKARGRKERRTERHSEAAERTESSTATVAVSKAAAGAQGSAPTLKGGRPLAHGPTWRVKVAPEDLDGLVVEITEERKEQQRARARLRAELARVRASVNQHSRALARAHGAEYSSHEEGKEQQPAEGTERRREEGKEPHHQERKGCEDEERKEPQHEESEECEDEGCKAPQHEEGKERQHEESKEGEDKEYKPQNEDDKEPQLEEGEERQGEEIGFWASCILWLDGLCCVCGFK